MRVKSCKTAVHLEIHNGIGSYVSANSRQGTWGTGAIEEISSRLREELPGLRGFSAVNIKFMRQFFEAWQPYFQTNTEYFPDSKSLTAVSDLVQTDSTNQAVSEDRLANISGEWERSDVLRFFDYLAHAQLSLPLPELNAVYVSVCDNCGAFHESTLQEL